MGAWEQVAISAFVSAFVTGLFLVGGYYYNRRIERMREEEQSWQRVGMPVINAADDLIARIFDIVVRGRTLKLESQLVASPEEVYNPSKEVSTVWRLMHFFAASSYLEQHVADERADSKIANLRFYANNKSRIPLKGNMYRASFPLQTEGQQLIGSKVLSLAPSREIRDADFFSFVKSLQGDNELLQSAEACRKLLLVNTDLQKLDGQYLCVAQFVIYLIDLVQDLRPSSKWEEFRLFLVVLLRSHNRASAGRASFLYQRGDIAGEDYLDTYNVLPSDKRSKRKRNRRLEKRAEMGFPRELRRDGVMRRTSQQEIFLRYADTPGDVKRQLEALFG